MRAAGQEFCIKNVEGKQRLEIISRGGDSSSVL